MNDRRRDGFRVLGVSVIGGRGQVQALGQRDGAHEAARAALGLLELVLAGGIGVGLAPQDLRIGAEPIQVEALGILVVVVRPAEDGGDLDLRADREGEFAPGVIAFVRRPVPVAVPGEHGARQAVVHDAGRAVHFRKALLEAVSAPHQAGPGRDRIGPAVAGQDVDDAAGRSAAVEGRRGPAQDLEPPDGGPIDIVKIGDVPRGIVQRDPVDERLDPAGAALGQDAFPPDREMDAVAVGLVVDLDPGDELQGLVDGHRPRHRPQDRRFDDRGRGRILLERDLDPRSRDGDLDVGAGAGLLFGRRLLSGGRRRLGLARVLGSDGGSEGRPGHDGRYKEKSRRNGEETGSELGHGDTSIS